MSFPSLADTELTISEPELKAAADSIGIEVPPSQIEAYLKFATGFDKACIETLSLPPYADPRLDPVLTTTPRTFAYPDPERNTLNAWSQQTNLDALKPTSSKLRGKTVAFKANIAVAGADLNNGTAAQFYPGSQFHVPSIDATVVRRVLEAGATVRGIGTCENFCLSALSTTAATGPVRNAWDPSRATGGSSSGVASLLSLQDIEDAAMKSGKPGLALAAEDRLDMAIGGDQGGSIRVPAHFSGIYGLKPTYGLVPYTGIAGLFPAIDHAGPMTRSVRDTALLLEVIAGADGIDFRQTPWTPLRENVPHYADILDKWASQRASEKKWTSSNAAEGLTVGVLKEGWEIAGLEEGVASVTRQAVERFASQGAVVKNISVPLHMIAGPLWAIYNRPGFMDSLSNQPPALLGHPLVGFQPLANNRTKQEFFEYISTINPAISNGILNAPLMAQKYGAELSRKAHMHVHELTAAFDAAFELEGIDVLVLPTAGTVAPVISSSITAKQSVRGNTRMETSLEPLEAAAQFVGRTLNTCGFNMTGHPAMSLPCGWAVPKDGPGPDLTDGRMPVGLQIVGRKWDDIGVLKAAMAWEVGGRAIDDIAHSQ